MVPGPRRLDASERRPFTPHGPLTRKYRRSGSHVQSVAGNRPEREADVKGTRTEAVTGFLSAIPEHRPGAPHLARFSRDVGYHRPPLKLLRSRQLRTGAPALPGFPTRSTSDDTDAAFSQRKPHEVAQRH